MTVSLFAASPRPSSVALEEDFGPSTNPRFESVLEAEVVLGSDIQIQNSDEHRPTVEIDEEDRPPATSGKSQTSEEKGRRNSVDPLFATLYAALACAIIFLAVALTRYIQFKRSIAPPPSPLILPENDATPNIVSDISAEIELITDNDPIGNRTNIEFILTVDLHTECSRAFFQGPQKMAIDWLVYEDRVLNATHISEMAESRGINGKGIEEPISAFPLIQRYALMVLFFGTGGELWSGEPWNSLVDVPVCKFEGVECDQEGKIIMLTMQFRKLRGRLPEELGMLTDLRILAVNNNKLEGSIPSFIYNRLTGLRYLDLSHNQFSSSISSDISKLSGLKALYLSELSLTGEIPFNAMTSLSRLQYVSFASATKLSGPILEVLPFWPNLKTVDLHSSRLTGTIPTTIGANTRLERLMMDSISMNFSSIPTEIGLLTNLKLFVARPNPEGVGGATIPTELGNCTNLDTLKLSQLSGSIPTELGRLTNLMNLWFTHGTLTGSLPTEIGQLTKLSTLSLSENQLEGNLPSEFGNLQELIQFDMRSNDFTGSIPSGVCKSISLSIDRDCSIEDCQCCSKCYE